MRNDPLAEITKRTQRYWYEDGIWEIGFGLANLLLGGFYLFTSRFEGQGPLALVMAMLQMGVIVGVFLLVGRLVPFLKERITYPRTGYVAYQRPTGKKRLHSILKTALLSGGVAALLGVFAAFQATENQTAIVASVVLSGALIFLGYRFDLPRFYALAALTIILGVVVAFISASNTLGIAGLFSGFGLLILISGLLTLVLYLRRTRNAATQDLADLSMDEDFQRPGVRDE